VSVRIFGGRFGRCGWGREKGVQSAGQDPLSPWGNTTIGQFSERAGEEHDSLSKDHQRHEQTWIIEW